MSARRRTYYFEVQHHVMYGSVHQCLQPIWDKMKTEMGLTYTKYIIYNLCMVNKCIGVMQFVQPVLANEVIALCAGIGVGIEMNAVINPLVLPHVRIWLMYRHHDCSPENLYEWGTFSFGYRQTCVEEKLKPYRIMLKTYIDSDYHDIKLGMSLEGGMKMCFMADALNRLPTDSV